MDTCESASHTGTPQQTGLQQHLTLEYLGVRGGVGANSKGYSGAPIAAADDTNFVLHRFCVS
jgi:hypothetical protein